MPELPEVQTIVSDLNRVLPGLAIRDVWCDSKKMVKQPRNFEEFKRNLISGKIFKVSRRGKNILIDLSGDKTLLIHQKMTGHLLYGSWKLDIGTPRQNNFATGHAWKSKKAGLLRDDPKNQFIHLVISLSNGKQLALSDLRKFAKVLIAPTSELKELNDLKNLGPEPLAQNFTADKFINLIRRGGQNGKVKQVLMDQKIIAGIGNIYSDEILWEAGIHPLKKISELNGSALEKIYKAIKKVLLKAVKAKGDSISDYRRPSGDKGGYQKIQNAYQMTGKKCKKKDGGIIKRIKLAGRSAHFCPAHQN